MLPSKEELLSFIRKNDLANYSAIARHFRIKNTTVSDLIEDLKSRHLVEIKKVGGSKIVRITSKKTG